MCLGHGFPASGGGVHGPSVDGLGASSLCRVGGDGPRQVQAPWAMSTNSSASPAASCLDTSGEMDREGLGSPCFDLDGLSSSDDDIGTLGGLSDISVTLLRDDDEVFSPVNSDQVPSDVDFPPEPGSHDKRQVVRRCDASPDVLPVAAPPVRRTGDPRRSVTRVPPGKRMPVEVSMKSPLFHPRWI